MALFPILFPLHKPNAAEAAREAGFWLRRHADGSWWVRAEDQDEADRCQIFVDGFPGLVAAKAKARQRLAEVARQMEREDEAQTRALGFHTEALRLIVANSGSPFASWPAAARQRMQQIAQRLERLEELARAADLIAADIEAMTDVDAIEAFDARLSSRWPAA